MAVDLTLRLIKGTELTFAEIDNNWQLLDHAIDSNKSFMDSQFGFLNQHLQDEIDQIILGRDSDIDEVLRQHDSDINSLINAGTALHDSEHAWNVQQHSLLESSLDSEHLWNVAEHSSLDSDFQSTIVAEVLARSNADSDLGSRIDSEHAWNIVEHDLLQTSIDSSIDSISSVLQNNIDSIGGALQNNIDSINNELNTITSDALQNVVEDSSPELGGDLVIGQNLLTFADTASTVSHIDFTKNIFGGTNTFVVSSVQDFCVFLDANGGGGHHFRIFSNEDPDGGSVIANDNIFNVDESGNTTATSFTGDTLTVGNWSLTEVGGELVISKSGTKKAKIKDNGEIVSIDDVTAYGTV